MDLMLFPFLKYVCQSHDPHFSSKPMFLIQTIQTTVHESY